MKPIITEEMVEIAAGAMYGPNWNGPDEDKRPGEKMKGVWRKYASAALLAVAGRIVEGEWEACAQIAREMREAAEARFLALWEQWHNGTPNKGDQIIRDALADAIRARSTKEKGEQAALYPDDGGLRQQERDFPETQSVFDVIAGEFFPPKTRFVKKDVP